MLIFIVALVSCSVLVLLLRGVAHRFGLVDHPGGRKNHTHPTPTVGGVAMFVAVLLALYWGDAYTEKITLLMECAALLVVLGLLDDRYGLQVNLRMMIQVFVALLVILGEEGTITHLGSLFGAGDIHLGLLAVPFSLVAFVGGINAMNMIDGADGMAGKMAVITVLGVAIIFYLSGAVELLPLTWAMFGALIGFLFFNTRLFVRRAWVFMGDAGSMWLGLVLGWFMAQVTSDAVSAEPALVFWLFGIPLIDTLTVMLRRLRRNGSPFAADRTHIHHVLEHAGLSVRRTVLVLSLAQLVLVGIGVCFFLIQAPAALVFWSFMLFMAVYYYRLRHCK
jgi:UDP-GlcNAc:undecaprenyl-phosphate GlcNAc-1-phosphate transferase